MEGLLGGGVVATSLPQPFPANGGAEATFVLIPLHTGTDGGATTDGANNVDGGNNMDGGNNNAVAITPYSTVSFPDTPRGSTSEAFTLTITNHGTAAVSLTSLTSNGDTASFPRGAGSSSECPAGFSLPGGASCTLTYTFTPLFSGSASQTIKLSFDNSQILDITMSGKGLPAWVAEDAAVEGSYAGVWGSTSHDVYAVGPGVIHTTGDGNWKPLTDIGPLHSIAGTQDGKKIWVGGDIYIWGYSPDYGK